MSSPRGKWGGILTEPQKGTSLRGMASHDV